MITPINLPAIDAVLFDLDGTLYDSRRLAWRFIGSLLRTRQLAWLAAERRVRRQIRGKWFGNKKDLENALFEGMAAIRHRTAKEARYWYEKDYMPLMVRLLNDHYTARGWVKTLLTELRAHGKTTVVYSDYGHVDDKLRAIGIDPEMFDHRIDAAEMGGLKPCQQSIEQVLGLMKIAPERCLIIGDRDDTDGRTAQIAGMQYIHITRTTDLRIEHSERYAHMEVTPDTYVPRMDIDYPDDDPCARLYRPQYIRELTIDENYDFARDDRRWLRRQRWGYCFILHTLLGLKLRIQMGLRVEGREWLIRYKVALKNGAITLGNHCYRLDCPAILIATGARSTTRIPMYAPNFRTKDATMMRLVGGVPIPPPESGMAAMKKFNAAFDYFHEKGYWFHIFPEAARWDFYKPLRPFQKGAFTMAYKYGMPLVPCIIRYRERTGLYRLFGKKDLPLLTVEIGEPILPNTSEPRKQEVERLMNESHRRMELMAGIVNNPW